MMIGKEEIIRTLDALANWQGSLSLTDKERVAIVTAMEAVKRQDKDVVPTEFHEKCMSKQLRRVAELEKQLKKLERPHGHWVYGKCLDGSEYCHCSECSIFAQYDSYGNYEESDFCPNCGADMRKEGEQNE